MHGIMLKRFSWQLAAIGGGGGEGIEGEEAGVDNEGQHEEMESGGVKHGLMKATGAIRPITNLEQDEDCEVEGEKGLEEMRFS
ncbi:hypothetical protein COCNU_02G001070 [Cocos nucifera]|uniref:Uncharacterized protein n=1 Tax=Cocos nucifera TaxID=13894 RepID=A0A8K0MW96_COCNU|nr:hypothetical protein COCNU_02G001060 [Cocos nucifera]KAG1330139.1 hypothetical protein COCNU_02G001070 [Cocos nucifera]